ncbi:MAG: hypothetical protein EPO35_04570 [Acidobacteria bacterium]|nr:MAG: hypothetical protein EPO35_04570 [Acidobacteriota bacterium]
MKTAAPLAGTLLAIAASTIGAREPAQLDTSAKSVVAAASAYVDDYNTKMQYVLADERATQRVTFARPVNDWTRTTKADLFITFLPAESVWIAVRDVREVDGTPVNDPDSIRALMDRAPLSRLGSVIAEKNARFNIGNISRTFNEPTLALLILTRKHRGRFRFDRVSVSADASPRVTISFKERDRPTLITGRNGAPVFASGILLIDAATGRVELTRIEVEMGSVTGKIETRYAEDPKLKLWAPSVMRETYSQSARGYEEMIACESTYTNYRKFDTSVVIK